MSDPAQLISAFYEAFSRRDWAAMGACYHPAVHFTDAVFDLHGDQARAMWRMLCTRGRDLQVEFSGVSFAGGVGRAHWDALYTFTATGRKVHNRVDARFAFQEGLIVRHEDSFDFWRWSRQALGAPGLLLGWSSFLHNKVRAQAARGLATFTPDAA